MSKSATRTITTARGRYTVGKSAEIAPDVPDLWATICQNHSTVIGSKQRNVARYVALNPEWCAECMEKRALGRPPLPGGRVTIRVRGQWQDGKRPGYSFAISNDHLDAIHDWAAKHTNGNASRALRDMIDVAMSTPVDDVAA